MLPFSTATAVLAGRLLAASFAAGLNLYATVALIGLAARIGWIEPLPPDLRGLSNILVIAVATMLFLIELVVEKLPFIGAAWTAAHTIIRPISAALLTSLALAALPDPLRYGAAAAAGLVAFAAHGAQSGLRVTLASAARPRSNLYLAAAALALDGIAICIAIAALLYPEAAVAVVAGALLVLLLVGPRLWRAATFGARALLARLVGFFLWRGWKRRPELPRRIRKAVPAPPFGKGEPIGTRAAAVGLPGAGAYRNGWLVFDEEGAWFVFRALTGSRRVALPQAESIERRPGPATDAVRITAGTRAYTLFLLKDGPSLDKVVTALESHA